MSHVNTSFHQNNPRNAIKLVECCADKFTAAKERRVTLRKQLTQVRTDIDQAAGKIPGSNWDPGDPLAGTVALAYVSNKSTMALNPRSPCCLRWWR